MVGRIDKATRFQPPVALTGPRAAVDTLSRINDTPREWGIWLEEARLHAILGACRGSIASVKSGIRCFVAFIGAVFARRHVSWAGVASSSFADASGLKTGSRYFPPTVEALLAWSRCFRNSRTWQNYIGYVKTACLVAGEPVEV